MARRGQQVVAGDRLADRIGIGVLAKVFTPELVDRVIDEVAVDGMCVDVPDTPENGEEFGYPGNDERRGPLPQVRVVDFG